MLVLTLRTDKPEAEVGVYDADKRLAYIKWQAHRRLAETIHTKIIEILNKSSNSMESLEGIVIFEGPGSFTGLRISMSVANALAYALEVPVVAKGGKNWITDGIKKLEAGQNDKIAIPKYGEPAKTTQSRK